MKPINLGIEAYDFCPLKCNSCPQGRREHVSTHRALSCEMLERMLERIRSQRKINTIGLIGWGEPLLNPDLPNLIRIGNRYGNVWVSTTGNFWKCDLKDLAASAPQRFSVSISGMTQATHLHHHENGDINKALAFIRELVGYGMPRISLIFHRYNNNLHEEEMGRRFAREWGLKWEPIWGRHHAVEDLILGKGNPYLIVPIPQQLEEARRAKPIECPIQTNHLAIGADGDVRGCVAATARTCVGNVLRDTVDEILARKAKYELCGPCYKAGVQQVICGQTIGADWTYAKNAHGTLRDHARWFVERMKKRTWINRD